MNTNAAGGPSVSVAVGDVNGDGQADLVAGDSNINTLAVSVLLNNSTPAASLDATSFFSATGSDTGLVVFTNTPPDITGTVAGQTITDQQAGHPFSGVTIVDPDGQTETLPVTLDSATKGSLFNLGGGSYNGSTGVYSISGTAAAVTAASEGKILQLRSGISPANHTMMPQHRTKATDLLMPTGMEESGG